MPHPQLPPVIALLLSLPLLWGCAGAHQKGLSEAEARERVYFVSQLSDLARDRLRGGASLPARYVVPPERAVAEMRAGEGEAFATWIGHASLLIDLGGQKILTDPVYSASISPLPPLGPQRLAAPGIPFEALPRIDVVLVSHNHYDHLDMPTLRRLAARRPGTLAIGPAGTGRYLAAAGFARIAELAPEEEIRHKSLAIRAIRAEHNSGRTLGLEKPANANSYLIEGAGRRLFFAGDTAHSPRFAKVRQRFGPADIAFVPIGAYAPEAVNRIYHVNPEDALRLARDLGAQMAVAMHWGTFALSPEPMLEPVARFRAAPAFGIEKSLPRIGETIRLPCPRCSS